MFCCKKVIVIFVGVAFSLDTSIKVSYFKSNGYTKKSNRKAMNKNWSNQKANSALKIKTEKKIIQIDKIH